MSSGLATADRDETLHELAVAPGDRQNSPAAPPVVGKSNAGTERYLADVSVARGASGRNTAALFRGVDAQGVCEMLCGNSQ